MEVKLVSLFIISLVALLSPLLALIIPRKIFPETVFLLVFGMIVGPNVLGIVQVGDAVNLLSDLGLGFLFLLAGYEIDVKDLTGKGGRHGLLAWIISFVVALVIFIPVGIYDISILGGFGAAIILTTTAFGTLVPILKDRGILGTEIGKRIVEYGVWGEIGPVLAMALLLTTRATWTTMLLLAIFFVVAIICAFAVKRLGREESKLGKLIEVNVETNAQMGVRVVVVLMVGLVALASVFDLDIVLGAFAAGFVMRIALPEGDAALEHKLNGLCYGFFIPLFIIVSGTKIDPQGVINEPWLLVLFIVARLVVRAVPIFVSLCIRKDTKSMGSRVKMSITLYCTTALPLIVAVSSVAESAGIISQDIASALVAAGGITVLIMPLMSALVMRAIKVEKPPEVHDALSEQ